jgi:hypothetical protein
MSAQLEVIGIRHHSPACARLVQARIEAFAPDCVLIEGPSDFSPRISELQMAGHTPPLAVFSYFSEQGLTRQVFMPFAECSPEWVALQEAARIGAAVRFIDLPYWHANGRERAELQGEAVARERQQRRELALARRFGMDGIDALWDHLFEQALPMDALQARLDRYFDELRADEPGDRSDRAREAHMAAWIRLSAGEFSRLLVVCGGWHRLPLLRALEQRDATDPPELELQPPAHIERYGHYLMPYSERRLEALGGYAAGTQSPAYYRRLYREGATSAADWAVQAVVQRWRTAKQPLSTASLIAATARIELLARLRGHAEPLRSDVLDGLLDALSSEALTAPPPWSGRSALSSRDDPALREALLALTGETVGQLAAGTPLPPLLREVEQLLASHGLDRAQNLQLDRRDPAQGARAEILWRLRLLDIPGFEHSGNSAPGAARQLGADQHPLEHWRLQPAQERLQVALIEAAARGPTLAAAALQRLRERIGNTPEVDALAELYAQALRAGYNDLGASILPELQSALAQCHSHGALGRAGLRLFGLLHSGLLPENTPSQEPETLLQPALSALLARLLWLLEGLSGPHQPASADEVDALRCIDRLLAESSSLQLDPAPVQSALLRIGQQQSAPPALRGASFAVLWRRAAREDAAASEISIDPAQQALLQAARALPDGETLGDFLFGLFALARQECAGSDALLQLLDGVVAGMSHEDFLRAVPALRQAFHYFPPRERAAIAGRIGALHGRSDVGHSDWLRLPVDAGVALRGAELIQAVSALRARYGL